MKDVSFVVYVGSNILSNYAVFFFIVDVFLKLNFSLLSEPLFLK